MRRAAIMREEIGDDRVLMVDANQAWDVDAGDRGHACARAVAPVVDRGAHEPDDILGHARIARAIEPLGIRVATGEHCHNRVMFKQFLQADAIGFCQIDACRLGGVNEVIAVLLLAAKHGVPVCPHAGGVGLCEYVQHLAMFDYIAVSGSLEGRVVEYVDHLHEHFVDPVVVRGGRYRVPEAPGYSITMKPASLERFEYPGGAPGRHRTRCDGPGRRGARCHRPPSRWRVSGRLEGKACLITGGGSGIGRATAIRFALEGAAVAVADVDPDGADATVALIADASAAAGTGRAVAFAVDVTDEASCEALAAAVVAELGRIDVLFNNAGIAGVGTVEETSLELWERVMAVNVRGVFLVAKAVLPVMVAAGRGSIINMSSTIAEIGLARRASYAASKGAVLALTRQMQADYAAHGIRVNALLPGTIHTPFVDRYLAESYDDPAAGLETLKQRQLTGDLGSPEDVASAALFLASDESRFVLGTGLFVDGGVRGAK